MTCTTSREIDVPQEFSLGDWRGQLAGVGLHSDGRRVLAAARGLLEQGDELLGVLTQDTYTRRVPAAFNASIGGHFRHCLDHFSSLLRACESEMVDYDHRLRDPRIESDPAWACQETRELKAVLESMDPEALDGAVLVRCEVSYERGESPVTRSTLGRELVYAIAHGIHHFALISVMARLQGVVLPPEFGMAPSTVVHRAALAAS